MTIALTISCNLAAADPSCPPCCLKESVFHGTDPHGCALTARPLFLCSVSPPARGTECKAVENIIPSFQHGSPKNYKAAKYQALPGIQHCSQISNTAAKDRERSTTAANIPNGTIKYPILTLPGESQAQRPITQEILNQLHVADVSWRVSGSKADHTGNVVPIAHHWRLMASLRPKRSITQETLTQSPIADCVCTSDVLTSEPLTTQAQLCTSWASGALAPDTNIRTIPRLKPNSNRPLYAKL